MGLLRVPREVQPPAHCCGGTHSESRDQSSCEAILKIQGQARGRRPATSLVNRATRLPLSSVWLELSAQDAATPLQTGLGGQLHRMSIFKG